jgi:hypothetical protein
MATKKSKIEKNLLCLCMNYTLEHNEKPKSVIFSQN